jgi:glycosyltransferase involved in cell wall biosynthesis
MRAQSQKLAVLMPVFNGGQSLLSSLNSCAQAGLPGTQYEIIIVDNCSTDGATTSLPRLDAAGATIQVHRNSSNIGRVGNWNRSIEIAAGQGFRYLTFLFAGDEWLPNGSLPGLYYLIRQYDASVGFSPFIIADENGAEKRSSQRFYTSAPGILTSFERFLRPLLASGLFPLGPIQANIYCISANHRVVFDEDSPTATDVRATLEFITQSRTNVAVVSKPFLKWREHPHRFHASMGPTQTMRDYFETFHLACEKTALPVDYSRAKTRVILNCARLIATETPVRKWPELMLDLLRFSRQSPYTANPLYLAEDVWQRFALGRHLLEVA